MPTARSRSSSINDLNILYLISYAGKAGTEKYVENLMRTYSAQGHRCFLAYMDGGELAEKAKELGCGVFRLDLRASRALTAARRLARLCAENDIDVVHAQYPRENLIAVLSRLFRRETRVVFTSHLTVRQGFLWRALNRLVTPHETACVAVCTQGANLLRQNGVKEEKICVIFNGVEPKPLPPRQNVIRTEFSLPEDCSVFLAMARYAPEKGLFFLLDALAQLKERTPKPFVCLIAGDGELFDAVGEGIRERGLCENVIRAGYRTDAETLLCSADAYVSSALYNEAMSFAALEAMECGLPLVMTDVGAGADLASGCGACVTPGDVPALCSAMYRLMTDDAYRRVCGENARRHAVTEFDLTRQTQELFALYEKGKPAAPRPKKV